MLATCRANRLPADRPKTCEKNNVFACFRCYITDWAGVVAWSALGGLLGGSWCILGLSWSHLGGILGQHTGLLEHILGVNGLSGSWTLRFGRFWDLPRGPQEGSRLHGSSIFTFAAGAEKGSKMGAKMECFGLPNPNYTHFGAPFVRN